MSKRTISVDGRGYIYIIGKSNVRVTDIAVGKSRAYPLNVVTGLDWSEIERGIWKRWLKITPADIERTIRNGLTEAE